jgi:triosephosphate isomerase
MKFREDKNMRKMIVAGNWKMNKTAKEAVELINELKPLVESDEVEVVFCTPFVSLIPALEAAKGTNIGIGAQNMYFEESGAYTGEIAPNMLTEIGVKYVVLGHSERRAYFGETNETVNKKVLKAIEHNLVPIICVGETLEQREQGITVDLVRLQTKIALKDVSKEDAKKSVIAYEPIWAIGTGKTATSQQAEEVCAAIRQVLAEVYDTDTAEAIRIQYGGSVNAKNAAELFAMPNIDGGLVGGASLKADFGKVVNYK